MGAKPRPEPEFSVDEVRDLSERVYRIRLGDEDVANMLKEDGDDGKKLRQRAGSYDALSRAYLQAFKHTQSES